MHSCWHWYRFVCSLFIDCLFYYYPVWQVYTRSHNLYSNIKKMVPTKGTEILAKDEYTPLTLLLQQQWNTWPDTNHELSLIEIKEEKGDLHVQMTFILNFKKVLFSQTMTRIVFNFFGEKFRFNSFNWLKYCDLKTALSWMNCKDSFVEFPNPSKQCKLNLSIKRYFFLY